MLPNFRVHATCTKGLQEQINAEVIRIESNMQSDPGSGLKRLPKTIGGLPDKPLLCAKRDEDTADGERKGE